MFHRLLSPFKSNSFFVFGPRGTGKTTLLKSLFDSQEAEYIDLLDLAVEEAFRRNPLELEARVAGLLGRKEWVIIDEVQRLPHLLNSVHRLIESTRIKFAVTGSSARKLRHGASNLLAGRAFVNHLHPLTIAEVKDVSLLDRLLAWGSLPKTFSFAADEERREYLRAYAHTYLREEIAAEQLVRRLDPFREFLAVAAQSNGQVINAAKIGRDVGIDAKTVASYFGVLDDTYMGFLLPAWHRSVRKRQATHPKFYFFDPGVKRALDRTIGQELYEGTFAYGNAFEHFVVLELVRLNDYARTDFRFSYLQTPGGLEIDLVIDRPGMPVALVEIKSTARVTPEDCSALNSVSADIAGSQAYCVSRDPHRKRIGTATCVPWFEIAGNLGLLQ